MPAYLLPEDGVVDVHVDSETEAVSWHCPSKHSLENARQAAHHTQQLLSQKHCALAFSYEPCRHCSLYVFVAATIIYYVIVTAATSHMSRMSSRIACMALMRT